MFENVHETWKRYAELVAPSWGADDPRHHLATEVRERLDQMTVLVAEARKCSEQWKAGIGGLTAETYPAFRENSIRLRLAVEGFYIGGWRVLRCLNNPTPLDFPHIHDVRVPSVEGVANAVLGLAGDRLITQDMQHTEAGPVLGRSGVVIETGTGRTYPSSESADIGLFHSTEQFRIALQGALDRAIKELSGA